jgi:3-hydroxy acid dehydrogenase/malonic semialdehyde reductase
MPAYLPKIVMITGSTGGFGQAFARKFAAAGCKLILTSRKPDKLDALAASLPVPSHKIIFDIRNRKAVEAAFATLPPEFRDIDLLINNAGGAFGMEPAYEASLDDWQAMIETNNLGLVMATHFVLPGMVKRKGGHIINMSSASGSYPYPGGHVYCATKAFVKQFSLALRADLIGTGVRVTNIEPGMVETEFSLTRFRGDAAKAASVYEGANPLTAADIAETVYWAATQPPHVNINRIELMPVTQGPGPLAVHRENRK